MESLGDILRRLGASRRGQALSVAGLRARWEEVAGDLACWGEPVRVERGTLWIRCVEPAAAHNWRLQKERVLERLRGTFPEAGIERLRVRA